MKDIMEYYSKIDMRKKVKQNNVFEKQMRTGSYFLGACFPSVVFDRGLNMVESRGVSACTHRFRL